MLIHDEKLDPPHQAPGLSDFAQRPTGGPARSGPEVRKPVTVLFSDLVESTRLGRQLDPEALRRLLLRYFQEMQSVVERHGGIVEKFIGDAVMAVFGVPVVREDDALRAVRAAAEMREALERLNRDLEQTWDIRLQCRIGVNTGEVVAGEHRQGHLIVTGEVVNIAKRLEEAAATGEILISEATYRLVRDAIVAERVSDRSMKSGEPLEAVLVESVRARVPGRARRFDSPLVGREQQLSALRGEFAGVVQDRACHLLTVLGPAGIGKSRLVQEFVGEARAPTRRSLHGHCLPYGEGITYWPLTEVVREILRREGSPEAESSEHGDRRTAPRRGEGRPDRRADLGGARTRRAAAAGRGEETSWAVRKLFEALARRRPLVIVFDDLQWAEPTFIELVDYLAELSRDAPILLLCMARPELFDSHPSWGGGKLNAASMLLEPLDDGELPEADREPARPRAAPRRGRDAHRRGGRRQRAVRRGVARDARRRRAARLERPPLGGHRRPPRAAGAADHQHAAHRPPRGPAGSRAQSPRCRPRWRARSSIAARSASSLPDCPTPLSIAASRVSSAAI